MLNVDGATSEGGNEINLAVVKKIVSKALEAGMGLLLNVENDVTSQDTRRLVTVAAKFDLGIIGDTLVDVNMENLAVDNGLLAVALLAAVPVLDDLTFTVTVRAFGLEALNHGSELAHHELPTVAVTARATLDGTLLTTDTLALGADDGALER